MLDEMELGETRSMWERGVTWWLVWEQSYIVAVREPIRSDPRPRLSATAVSQNVGIEVEWVADDLDCGLCIHKWFRPVRPGTVWGNGEGI
jgi:hypothetical protein